MKNLFYFIAGVLFITLISATTISIMTIKPIAPKDVIVLSDYYIKINPQIISYTKQGYIVKTMVGNSSGITIVMEKY
jgi:hypothetical protein